VTIKRRTNPLWGLIALGAAGLALAQALGVVPAGAYDLALRAVPALLIVAGLTFLLRSRTPLATLIGLIAAGGVTAAIAVSSYSSRADQPRTDSRIPVEQAISPQIGLLRLRVETLASDVELIRAAGTQRSVGGEFVGSTASRIAVEYGEPGDNAASLLIREAQDDGFPLLEAVGRGRLRLELPADLPLDLELLGSGGAVTLNLSDLALERLNVTLTRGDLVVTLPDYQPTLSERGESLGTLTASEGGLTMFVPPSVAARFELNRGGSGIDPIYDESLYNYLVGDVLESRTIDTAPVAAYYVLTAPRGRIRIQVAG
jgi:hypothetical protein